ncbi:MAG: DNA polymerase IV [Cyanobacteria bacterium P01_F01_bin.53]
MRKVVHIDMDAFFASVEQRDFPNYRNQPIAVGGTPAQRGVVATASYEARKFGVRSAMPSRTALQLCPQLIFVPPRFDIYRSVSQQIQEIFFRYTDLVEPLSLDEAYLDVTDNKLGIDSATRIARLLRQDIRRETNLTASAGVSCNKFLAKIASGMQKPDGLYVIPPAKAEAFVDELAIEEFFGIGPATAKKLIAMGVKSGADLKQQTLETLVEQFGKRGHHFYSIARAIDQRPVEPDRLRKSIGVERSYVKDLSSPETISEALGALADSLQARLEKHGCRGRTLTLKVKYSNYEQVTRSLTLETSFHEREIVLELASDLLRMTEVNARPVRLLGLTASNISNETDARVPQQLSLPIDVSVTKASGLSHQGLSNWP